MFKYLFCIVMLSLLCQAKVFRFDYEFVEPANGWMKFHIVPSTWREARMRCHAEGAVLASPLTDQLKKELIRFVLNKKGSIPTKIFTGVHASFSKGDYASIEGVPLTRLPISWAPGEPDNCENKESCLAMFTDGNGSTYDVRCDDVLPYVCFKKFTKLTMSDCGTTDPEYFKEPRTGSCYKYHNKGLIWSEAYMTCVAEGGHLAVINSALEARAIQEFIARHPENQNLAQNQYRYLTNIGFHDWGHYGTNFMTIHGESLDVNYDEWENGEPNNLTSTRSGDLGVGEYCGSVSRTIKLNDVFCNILTAFLCEKMPNSLSHDYKV